MRVSAGLRKCGYSSPSVYFAKKEIHVFTDAIAQSMADAAYSIESGDQGRLAGIGQSLRSVESLPEHAHQCVEVDLVVIAGIVTKPGALFAKEHHQLRHPGGIPNGFLVVGDGLFSFGDGGSVLPAKDVRVKPPGYRLLVGFQDILDQAKTVVKKRLIVRARSVEMLEQA